jgi:Domain of unknown function (DUF4149)
MGAPGYLARARIALLGSWVGAMAAFGGLFVPAAFAHLPTQLAAGVLGDGFAAIDQLGAAIGLTCVALGFAARPKASSARLRALLPLAGVLAHGISFLVVNPKLHALRLAAGGAIGQLPADGPELAAFSQLHAASRGLFGLAAASALAACLWDVFSLREGGSPGASPDGERTVF